MSEGTQFRLLGEEEARRILNGSLPKTAETYHLRVRAGRRLMEVTTAEERAAAQKEKSAHELEIAGGSKRKLERLRALANARKHRCAGYGCETMVEGHVLMCYEHWVLVPDWLQEKLVGERDANAAMQWPLELVEQAIRHTMLEGDLHALVERLAAAHQADLFPAAAAAGAA